MCATAVSLVMVGSLLLTLAYLSAKPAPLLYVSIALAVLSIAFFGAGITLLQMYWPLKIGANSLSKQVDQYPVQMALGAALMSILAPPAALVSLYYIGKALRLPDKSKRTYVRVYASITIVIFAVALLIVKR